MKKINLLSVLLFVFFTSFFSVYSQNPGFTVIEYMPAPGQHINIETAGTPQAAHNISENYSNMVSLGSFGGYIVLKFNKACINHPENPYGIDFSIFGNAFSGSSEPGVVWVMKDSNLNGLADDTWYEIAGSNHFFSGTKRKYEVTYYRTATRDVYWKDAYGAAGQITANEFNLQEYYPSPVYFSSYPVDSVYFTGTLLKSNLIRTGSGEIMLKPPAFGYADSHARVQNVNLSFPDNPYTKAVEGAGGDPVDIAWATDGYGNYVSLDSIHFVKIASASLHVAGWLGELSTDVAWLEPTQPQSHVTGKESLLVYSHHPSKVLLGDSLKLEAFYFDKGRRTEEQVIFRTVNDEVAFVGTSGIVRTISPGETQIEFAALDEKEYSSVKVVVPDSIRFLTDFRAIYPGDTLEIHVEVYDNYSEVINLVPRFSSSSPSTAKAVELEGKTFLVALQPGELILKASIGNFQLEKSVSVKVHSVENRLNVLLSIKTAGENLLPLQSVEIGLADLNAFVENRQHNYSGMERITLFHALASGLQKAGVPFGFRDDEAAGGKLYLYMVEHDGLFSYGWGGKISSAAFARAWIAKLNDKQFINDFDNILISEGDTIMLYHVGDIMSDWIFTRLLPGTFFSASGEKVEVTLEQTSCSYENGEIKESGFKPVMNAPVTTGDVLYTDEGGKVLFFPGSDFPYVLRSGNDAFLLSEDLNVGSGFLTNRFTFYPNPVEDWLFVGGKISGIGNKEKKMIGISDSAGRIIISEEAKEMPVVLNVSNLLPGVYQLIVVDGNQPEIHKFIKR